MPKEVFAELSNPSIPHIRRKAYRLRLNGDIAIKEILTGTEEYDLYYKLAISPPQGEKRIGKGEAAAIALAKVYNGVLASNNLKDISKYVKKYDLDHIATGDILIAAFKAEYMDEHTGNEIWTNMILKRRILPAKTFSDYLKNYAN